jgi:hypothetical protein
MSAPRTRPDGLPTDLEAEEQTVAAALVSAVHDLLPEMLTRVAAADFWHQSLRHVWEEVAALAAAGEKVNQITVAYALSGRDRLEDIGGQTYLAGLIRDLPTPLGARDTADRVRELAVRRRLMSTATAAIAAARDRTQPVAETLSALQSPLSELRASLSAWQGTVPCGSALVNWEAFWESDPKAEDWLIEPLIPRGRQVALYSPAKQGKSLLMLDVAARAATGGRVLDRAAGEHLTVVYFDLEMTEGDLYERLQDMGYGPGVDLSRLHYYLLPTLPPLDTPEGGRAILSIAQHHNADLVIVDTTSRVLNGPENDADTLRAFYINTGLPLKADNRTLVRLDHAGKDLGKGQRGTSAKNDDVDLVWELTAQDDDGIRLRATHRRQSWVPEIINLIRLTDPLRHERDATSWPSGTTELARLLDDLETPVNVGQRQAREALQAAGHKARNTLLAAALRFRKEAGITAGITIDDEAGITTGNHPAPRLGNHPGITGNHPPRQVGITVPPVRGDSFQGPESECVDCGASVEPGRERCSDCALPSANREVA